MYNLIIISKQKQSPKKPQERILLYHTPFQNRKHSRNKMIYVMRKPTFCICENKDADQLRGNREADQRLCFRYTDSTIPLLPIYEISSLQPSSVAVQPSICRTWSETPKTGFLTTRLKMFFSSSSTIDEC